MTRYILKDTKNKDIVSIITLFDHNGEISMNISDKWVFVLAFIKSIDNPEQIESLVNNLYSEITSLPILVLDINVNIKQNILTHLIRICDKYNLYNEIRPL